MPPKFRHLRINVEPDPDEVEVRELRGQKHLVAPVVAVAEGILNGGYLPFREIQKSAPGWNGVPITVNHPEDANGNFVPANQAETLEDYQIGRFLDVEATEPKLEGNLWINLASVKWLTENTEELGEEAKQAVTMLKDGDPLEVSTGYFHAEANQSGEFDGQTFETTQVDLLPDHLAVLPNAEGACNWEGDSTASGCGAPRTNSARDSVRAFAANLGLIDDDEDTDPTDGESYHLHGVNCDCGGCSFKMGSTNDDPCLETLANLSAFSVEELREMDENQVQKIAESFNELTDEDLSGESGEGGEPTGNSGGDDPSGDEPPEWAQNLEQRVEDLASEVEAQKEDEREALVEQITANSNFEEDELPESVEKLEAMAEKLDAQTDTEQRFDGRAFDTEEADDFGEYEVGGAFASQELEELADSGGD